ncbi:DUF1772 domain-containing protein [Streptomyces olivoverticillatus]|uniref:anthrone oxygenase family protein n=1 Tax=Streptomyces olivoverticillatus TaxID=66427 RepID=UPI00161783E3
MIHLVSVVVLLGSGIVAGVFFAVAVSVLPALAAMSPDRYLHTHQLLGKGYHPAMPLLVNATLLADIALAVLVGPGTARALLIATAVGIVVVEAVSHLCNAPINKEVGRTSAQAPPADWRDPRPRWRRWHMVRTAAALLVLVLNSYAVTLGG